MPPEELEMGRWKLEVRCWMLKTDYNEFNFQPLTSNLEFPIGGIIPQHRTTAKKLILRGERGKLMTGRWGDKETRRTACFS